MDFLYESGFFWMHVAYKIGRIGECVCVVGFLIGIARFVVAFCCCAEKADQISEIALMAIGQTRRSTICCLCFLFLGMLISTVAPSDGELKAAAIYAICVKKADSLKEKEIFQTLLNLPDHNKKSK